MRRKTVETRTIEELSDWSAKRLLGRLRSLQKLEVSVEQSDMTCEEAVIWCEDKIGFKNDARWSIAHAELRDILALREHIK